MKYIVTHRKVSTLEPGPELVESEDFYVKTEHEGIVDAVVEYGALKLVGANLITRELFAHGFWQRCWQVIP